MNLATYLRSLTAAVVLVGASPLLGGCFGGKNKPAGPPPAATMTLEAKKAFSTPYSNYPSPLNEIFGWDDFDPAKDIKREDFSNHIESADLTPEKINKKITYYIEDYFNQFCDLYKALKDCGWDKEATRVAELSGYIADRIVIEKFNGLVTSVGNIDNVDPKKCTLSAAVLDDEED